MSIYNSDVVLGARGLKVWYGTSPALRGITMPEGLDNGRVEGL